MTNDLVWWVPFALIVYRVYDDAVEERHRRPAAELAAAMAGARCQDGRSLLDLSRERPTLAVFLRHLG